MTFVESVCRQLESAGDTILLRELRANETVTATGRELLERIGKVRAYLRGKRLKKGDRCALLAHNSIDWIAVNLAIIAEGLIVVPLYARQAVAELVAMMKDSSPSLILCGDESLRSAILQNWPEAPPQHLFAELFQTAAMDNPEPLVEGPDIVTIIYTSGTSGSAKGVPLTAANVGFMLERTSGRLSVLMNNRPGQDRIYQYLPFCFGASWIALLTYLLRRSDITLNTDLTRIGGEIAQVAPDYFLNVPALLERMRKAVDEQVAKKGGITQKLYANAKAASARQREARATFGDGLWLAIANRLVFPTISRKMLGPKVKALICGSAPLTFETQLYFQMLGIPVLQVYGLTETTGICTMDHPHRFVPGRVGPAIEGIEMKLGDNDEILVRGPNIFPGYWNRPADTANALRDGWFHTGDQGELDASGTWRIVGRVKNLIILGSGHKLAPEPIEDEILKNLPGAQQVVLAGNGRGYLSALVTGEVLPQQVQSALDAVNPGLPHYKQIRAFHIRKEPFSIDNGLLTANGKLKRDLIAAKMKNEIEGMYGVKQPA